MRHSKTSTVIDKNADHVPADQELCGVQPSPPNGSHPLESSHRDGPIPAWT